MIRWINAGNVSGLRSQSIYHGVAHAKAQGSDNIILVSIPQDKYVCVGYFQDPERVLNRQFCEENNLRILRRQTGGGAVLIDQGQIFIQWIFNAEDLPARVSEKTDLFLKPMVHTYRYFGIEAYTFKHHDVHVHGKKIVGTGAARIGYADVLTGNFILDFNLEMMGNVLDFPGRYMQDHFRDGLRTFMSSFSRELGQSPPADEIVQVYLEACKKMFDTEIAESEFSEKEMESIRLFDTKLSDDSWTNAIRQKKQNVKVVKVHADVWLGNHFDVFEGFDNWVDLRLEGDVIGFLKIRNGNPADSEICRYIEERLLGATLEREKLEAKLRFNNDDQIHFENLQYWLELISNIQKEKSRISGGI